MQVDRYSRTALAAAFYRAQHHLHDEPKLLDDPYAQRLLTAAEMSVFAQRYVRAGLDLGGAPGAPETVLARALRETTAAATVLARARYTEDRLTMAVGRGVAQYVLVGAGLDSFAFRRADLRDRVTGLDPSPLGAELKASGWMLIEQLDAAEIDQRYFAMRTDGYRARRLGHLACAGVV